MSVVSREEFAEHRKDVREDKRELLAAIGEVRDLVRSQNGRLGTVEQKVAALETDQPRHRDNLARIGALTAFVGVVLTIIKVMWP